MKRTNIYLEVEQAERLAQLASEEGLSRAELIRRLIDRHLNDGDEDLESDLAAIEGSFAALGPAEALPRDPANAKSTWTAYGAEGRDTGRYRRPHRSPPRPRPSSRLVGRDPQEAAIGDEMGPKPSARRSASPGKSKPPSWRFRERTLLHLDLDDDEETVTPQHLRLRLIDAMPATRGRPGAPVPGLLSQVVPLPPVR